MSQSTTDPQLDFGDEVDLTHAIVTAVAEAEGVGPLDLPPLYAAIEADVIEDVVDGHAVDSIVFTYCGYRVSVTGDGDIDLTD